MSLGEAASLAGRVFGDFVLVEPFATGGQGDVFLARQPALQRKAIVKVLRGTSEATTRRFLREAQLASKLDHPYAAHVYAFGAEPDGVLWIAMELVRGTSLGDWLAQRGPIPLARFVPLLERICEVLATAHESGIVHRDLKPDNIMVLARAGRLLPKLLDFGIAKALGVATEPAVPFDTEEFQRAASDGLETLAEVAKTLGSGGVTQAGAIVGSPRYMAPEQWFDPSGAGLGVDVYALGAVIFEALTGEAAVRGDTVLELATAHAKSPPPSLPASFPPALSAVIARAMAKRPEARFDSALALAGAVREASGTVAADDRLPPLDETLSDAVLTTAPQSIAECIASYQGARTFEQGQRALVGLAEASLDFVLLASVCGRRQCGGLPRAEDEARVAELVARWCGVGLNGTEKLELSRLLIEPFSDSVDLFPLPELVLVLQSESGALDRLATFALGTGAESAREVCEEGVAANSSGLSELAFLADYPLVARAGDRVVRWVGGRRRRASVLDTNLSLFVESEPVIADAEGLPLIDLHPLMQIARPSPGESEELFVLARGHHLGAVLVARPVGFERRDDQVLSVFAGLLSGDERLDPSSSSSRAPYRGLATFSSEDADWFFGREKEAEAFANRLRTQQFIAVVGPSGVGKSSFVRAGVLPRIGEVISIILRPGSHPSSALVAAVNEATGSRLTDESEDLSARLRKHLEDHARSTGCAIIIVVDQFEELVTLCADPDERELFGSVLVNLGFTESATLRVVVTLRDDFLMRLEQIASLRNFLGRGIQLLSTPVAADLRRTLTEPAAKVGYAFDPPTLPDDMVRDVEARPGALALLSFTALKLWEVRDQRYRKLQNRSYERMGGVGGALAKHAEETLESLDDSQRRLVREAFRRLVTAEGTRAVLAKHELLEVLGASNDAETVLESLISARLLSGSEGEDDEERVEVVHEALLSAWPRLVAWRQADSEGARLRDQLRDAARQWRERGEPRGLLWRGEALTEYKLWRARYEGELTRREQAFASASLTEASRGRRLRRLLLAGSALVLVATSVVLLILYRNSQEQERVAVRAEKAAATSAEVAKTRFLDLLVEQARLAALDHRPLASLAYLEAAHASGGRSTMIDYLATSGFSVAARQLASYSGHRGRVTSVAADAAGTKIIGSSWTHTDPRVIVWDVDTAGASLAFEGHKRGVEFIELAANDSLVASLDRGGEALVWAIADGEVRARFAGISDAKVSADGKQVALASAEGLSVFDIASSVTTKISSQKASSLAWIGSDVVFARVDGSMGRVSRSRTKWTANIKLRSKAATVVFAFGDRLLLLALRGEAFLVDGKTGGLVGRLEGLRGEPTGHAVSASAGLIAIATGSQIGVWNTDGQLLRLLEGDGSVVETLAFNDDGTLLAAGTTRRTIIVYKPTSGLVVTRLDGHTDTVSTVRFMPGRNQVISGGNDLAVKRWSTDSTDRALAQDSVDALVRSSSGAIFALKERTFFKVSATVDAFKLEALANVEDGIAIHSVFPMVRGNASDDGTIALPTADGPIAVDSTTGEVIGRCPGKMPLISSASISADGRYLAGTDRGGGPRVCDLRNGGQRIELAGPKTNGSSALVFDLARHRMIAAGPEVAIWALDGARREGIKPEKATAFWMASPRGETVVTASIDGAVRVWKNAEIVREYQSDGFLLAAELTPALVLALDLEGDVLVWDRESAKLLGRLVGGSNADAFFVDDAKGLLVRHTDGRLLRWQIELDKTAAARLSRSVKCDLPYRVDDGELRVISALRERCD